MTADDGRAEGGDGPPSGHAIDPELAAALPGLPSPDLDDIPATRRMMREMLARLPSPDGAGVEVTARTVPGADGAPDVPVRVYRPEHGAPVGVLDVHGGGFVTGSPDGDHAANLSIARSVGAVVVSVDYRLAPEHPYPAGLEDCYSALHWFALVAPELGVDPRRIALHGMSAGAGLCAGVALLARDRGGPAVAFQYLGSPELDDRLATPSMRRFTDTPLFDRGSAESSWEAYLGPGVRGTDRVSPYAAPARATDLRGLPAAYVSAQAFDPLRDEAIAYAQSLLVADVPVELHLFSGTFHGSSLIRSEISRRESRERAAVLRRGLGLPPA